MFTKPIDEITFKDVKNFCQKFPEGVSVEYKQKIENIKKNIPKIVSSFANELGGIFIIGVEADQINNCVKSIPGIPPRNGIEEQILESALTGIYPPVIPKVKILGVPNSNNVVVVVRVDESVQAPHAIQNSTRTYIRTGSITQTNDLADIDRVKHMLKRREDSQFVARQILKRIEERTEKLCVTDEPNITVIVRPIFPYRPVISTAKIYEVARKEIAPTVEKSSLRRVVGGTCFLIGKKKPYILIKGEKTYNCLELNDHGIVYYRQGIEFGVEVKHIFLSRIVWAIGYGIEYARSLYEKCDPLGNLEITVQLRGVFGEQLRFYEGQGDDEWKRQQSLDSEIPASVQCFSRDLVEREKNLDLVDNLAEQILWAFNVDNPTKRKELVEDLLEANGLLPT